MSDLFESIKAVMKADKDQLAFVCGANRDSRRAIMNLACALQKAPKAAKRGRSTRGGFGEDITRLLERGCSDDRIKEIISRPAVRLALEQSKEPSSSEEVQVLIDRIKKNAHLAHCLSVVMGFVWAQITIDFEHFVVNWRRENSALVKKARQLSSLLRVRDNDPEYRALSAAWNKIGTGYALSTMIQYVEVGRLLRAFPRLKFFGMVSSLIGREKTVRKYLADPVRRDYWANLPSFASGEHCTTSVEVEINAQETQLTRDQRDAAAMEIEQQLLKDKRATEKKNGTKAETARTAEPEKTEGATGEAEPDSQEPDEAEEVSGDVEEPDGEEPEDSEDLNDDDEEEEDEEGDEDDEDFVAPDDEIEEEHPDEEEEAEAMDTDSDEPDEEEAPTKRPSSQ